MTQHAQAAALLRALVNEVGKTIVGKPFVLDRIALALACDGHVLLEDYPGVAKTLTVKSFAQALDLPFGRVQFTPDLLPADITGSFYFNLQANRFEMRKGPIFTSFLLADEINRAPPKTQSALLEAMQERQATVEGETHPLPKPFFVFATQNPIETEGTYPLPEAQLDRFLMRIGIGYPSPEAEVEILRRRERAGADERPLKRVLTAGDLATIQRAVETVRVDDEVKAYIVRLVNATRHDERLQLGASPRGTLAVYKLSKAHAVMCGRAYVVPDDVKAVAVHALAHRLMPTAEARIRGVRPEAIVEEMLRSVPTPPPPSPAPLVTATRTGEI